jgi:hypothetical protein
MISVLPVRVSKILFGTMDSEDASYYTDKISNFGKKQKQIDFLKFSKEEVTVVKANITVNEFQLNGCIRK